MSKIPKDRQIDLRIHVHSWYIEDYLVEKYQIHRDDLIFDSDKYAFKWLRKELPDIEFNDIDKIIDNMVEDKYISIAVGK